MSHSMGITSGGPHGSILGLILFLLYLSDLFRVSDKLKLSTCMFGDGTEAFMSPNSLDALFDVMNTELGKIVEWFNINKLSYVVVVNVLWLGRFLASMFSRHSCFRLSL